MRTIQLSPALLSVHRYLNTTRIIRRELANACPTVPTIPLLGSFLTIRPGCASCDATSRSSTMPPIPPESALCSVPAASSPTTRPRPVFPAVPEGPRSTSQLLILSASSGQGPAWISASRRSSLRIAAGCVCSGVLSWSTLTLGSVAACLTATGRKGSTLTIRPTDACRCVPPCLTSSLITSLTPACLPVR